MNNEYTYITLTRPEEEPCHTFAEIKYGKIVSINKHWVPLDEYIKFFDSNALFLDITGVLINGEPPAIGDSITTTDEGYKIIHIKNSYSMAESKNYTIEKLKLIRNQKELEDIEVDGILFDADKDSILRIDAARKCLEDNSSIISSIEWTTADNKRITATIDTFKKLNSAITERSNSLHIRYNELKKYINDIQDTKYLPIIAKIDWNWDISCNLDEKLQEIQLSK